MVPASGNYTGECHARQEHGRGEINFTANRNYTSECFLAFEKEPAISSKRTANSIYFAFVLQVLQVGKQFATAKCFLACLEVRYGQLLQRAVTFIFIDHWSISVS